MKKQIVLGIMIGLILLVSLTMGCTGDIRAEDIEIYFNGAVVVQFRKYYPEAHAEDYLRFEFYEEGNFTIDIEIVLFVFSIIFNYSSNIYDIIHKFNIFLI